MKTATVSTLKASLSKFLELVRHGEEVIITDHGKPVGRLSPIFGGEHLDRRLERLVKEGLVSPPRARRSSVLKPPSGTKPTGAVAALLRERAEGR